MILSTSGLALDKSERGGGATGAGLNADGGPEGADGPPLLGLGAPTPRSTWAPGGPRGGPPGRGGAPPAPTVGGGPLGLRGDDIS